MGAVAASLGIRWAFKFFSGKKWFIFFIFYFFRKSFR
jgi:hypothetical protein